MSDDEFREIWDWLNNIDTTPTPALRAAYEAYKRAALPTERAAYLAGWKAAQEKLLEICRGFTRVPMEAMGKELPTDKAAELFLGLLLCDEVQEMEPPHE